MKKFGFLLCALAAITLGFSSCTKDKDKDEDLDNIIEDGCYIVGEATAIATLDATDAVKSSMAAGKNEAKSNELRPSMFEKYVALEAGKEFSIVKVEGVDKIHYGATLETAKTDGSSDQITIDFFKGTLAENVKMSVKESGLYHIVVDFDLKAVYAIPVIWGVRGVNDDWGWKAMEGGAFGKDAMSWTIKFDEVKAGKFKFAYGGGWKLFLDADKTISVNTNLGNDMENGGSDIQIRKATDATLKLTWSLAKAEIKNSYAWDLQSTVIVEKPAEFLVGFSGANAVFADQDGTGEWADPQEKTKALYNAEASNFDATTFDGTYVYNITGIKMGIGNFKARFNGAWLGFNDIEIAGDAANFTEALNDKGEPDGGNIAVVAEKNYDVTFTAKWKDGQLDGKLKVEFTAK